MGRLQYREINLFLTEALCLVPWRRVPLPSTTSLNGADCLSTIGCFRQMGIDIQQETDGRILVQGKGIHGLTAPSGTLNVGNSGTTTRLISGILSAQSFTSFLSGDDSLNSRPMGRIIRPLSMMGARIEVCPAMTVPL